MSRLVGLDVRSEGCRLAVVDTSAERPRVLALETVAPEAIAPHLVAADRVTRAVPDQAAIVKRLRSPGGEGREAQDRLTFELAQCLLDDASAFDFRFHPTADRRYVIAAAFRHQVLSELPEPSPAPLPNCDHHLRSVAIGRAYLSFCRGVSGTLVAVVEVDSAGATLCLVHDNQISDVAAIRHGYDNLGAVDQQERLAIDLKTIVNFRLAALMDQGISQPLAGLVIYGERVDDDCRGAIQRYFPVGVSAPHLNTGYFEPERLRDLPPAEASRYLVALGLAVN